LGYVTAPPAIIDRLRQLRQPWTVSALAIEAGKFLVKHHPQVIPNKLDYLREAKRLHDELNATEGLMLMDSDTNFMLAYIEHGSAGQLKDWLLDNYGILVRDASNFHGLDNRCFRVSAQTPRENNVLIAALREYLQMQQLRRQR
jgi:threonine-phosphate decarboxylase